MGASMVRSLSFFFAQYFYLGKTSFDSLLSFGRSIFQETILTSDLESTRCSAEGNEVVLSKIDRTMGRNQDLGGRCVYFR